MLICPICQEEKLKIDKQHLKKHGLTTDEYFSKYGNLAVFGYSKELSDKKSGKNHPLFGKKRSDEDKKKIGEATKKYWIEKGPSEKQIEHARRMGFNLDGSSVNIGKTYKKTDEEKNRISLTLLKTFSEKPKQSYDKNAIRYENQLKHIAKLSELKKTLTKEKFKEQSLPKLLEWSFVKNQDKIVLENNGFPRFELECKKCNSILNVAYKTLQKHNFSNTICQKCYPPLNGESKGEKELALFIESLGLKIERRNKSILGNNFEIDIFIPEKNIGIEYHGLYWHSSKMNENKNAHRDKYNKCTEKNIHLIQIFEDEWLINKEKTISRVSSILGINKNIIFARKCKIKKVTSEESKIFLNENHMQGCGSNSSFNYGLYKDDELISLMTFGKARIITNRKSVPDEYEMYRFCSKLGFTNIGGFNKLLKNFIKIHNPKRIISYGDLRFLNHKHNVYVKNGFTLKSLSGPGYFYTDFIKRYHRWGFRKPSNLDIIITEKNYWKQHGFYTIFDCGQALFEMEIKNK